MTERTMQERARELCEKMGCHWEFPKTKCFRCEAIAQALEEVAAAARDDGKRAERDAAKDAIILRLIEVAQYAMPPGHGGGGNPDSVGDADCMTRASLSKLIGEARAVILQAKPAGAR